MSTPARVSSAMPLNMPPQEIASLGRLLDPPAAKHGLTQARDGHLHHQHSARIPSFGISPGYAAAFPCLSRRSSWQKNRSALGGNMVRFHRHGADNSPLPPRLRPYFPSSEPHHLRPFHPTRRGMQAGRQANPPRLCTHRGFHASDGVAARERIALAPKQAIHSIATCAGNSKDSPARLFLRANHMPAEDKPMNKPSVPGCTTGLERNRPGKGGR